MVRNEKEKKKVKKDRKKKSLGNMSKRKMTGEVAAFNSLRCIYRC